MTINEIKEIFDLDIKLKKRSDLYVYLRALYVEEHLKTTNLNRIGKDLDFSRPTLLNSTLQIDTYRLDPLFMLVEKAFKTKDVNLIKEYINLVEERRLERSRSNPNLKFEKPKINKDYTPRKKYKKEPKIIILEHPKEDIRTVASKLRKLKTYLNDKPFPEWTNLDWKKYFDLTKN